MSTIVELQVRLFYTSNEGEVVPVAGVMIKEIEKLSQDELSALVKKLVKSAKDCTEDKSLPVTNIRQMTKEEVEGFITQEQKDEEGEGPVTH